MTSADNLGFVHTSFPQCSSTPPQPKLLALMMDWVLDVQAFTSVAGNQRKGVGQCLPPEALLGERCLQVACSLQLHCVTVNKRAIGEDIYTLLLQSKLQINYYCFFRFCPYWQISFLTLLCQNRTFSSVFFASCTGP